VDKAVAEKDVLAFTTKLKANGILE
jgi:hypothetical protein